tara:strand:- start:4155 stop:4850 length:696 start_codon:yes stop_codon:yes gene_type:complete
MPNRILRDWTDSLTVNELSAEEERFFVRLIMKADDFGRFHAEPRLLKSALFPLSADICPQDVVNMLSKCQRVGLIILGTCKKGREYLQIVNHQQRTRTQVSKFPEFETLSADNCQQPADICRPETYTETETYSDTKTKTEARGGDGKNALSNLRDSSVPTKDEVFAYAEIHGIPRDSARGFYNYFENNQLWLNRHDRLIKWQGRLKQWAEQDRQTAREKQGKRKLHPSIVQ